MAKENLTTINVDPILRDRVLNKVINWSHENDHLLSLEEITACDPQYNSDYQAAVALLTTSLDKVDK